MTPSFSSMPVPALNLPKRQWYEPTLNQMLALIAIAALFTAILLPILAHQDTRPYGVFLDAQGRPVPRTTVRFRDANGSVVATFQTDNEGSFRWRGLRETRKGKYTAEGWGLTRFLHSSGGSDRYRFTPAGVQRIVARDANGNPAPGLRLHIQTDQKTYQGAPLPAFLDSPLVTDASGVAEIGPYPAGVRFFLWSDDPGRYARIKNIRVSPGEVLYEARVGPTATLRGTAVRADATPLRGGAILARPQDARIPRNGLGVTGAEGRFEIKELAPGAYRLCINGQDISRITVAEGETRPLHLRSRQETGANAAK